MRLVLLCQYVKGEFLVNLRAMCTKEQVLTLNRHIADGSEALWDYAEALIADAAARGYLRSETDDPDTMC